MDYKQEQDTITNALSWWNKVPFTIKWNLTIANRAHLDCPDREPNELTDKEIVIIFKNSTINY